MRIFSLSEKQADWWAKRRAKGFGRFIAHWVLVCGLPMAALLLAAAWWDMSRLDSAGFHSDIHAGLWSFVLPFAVAICVLGAALLAVVIWLLADWQYRRTRPGEATPFKRTHVLIGALVVAVLISVGPDLLERLDRFVRARAIAAVARMSAPYDHFQEETAFFRREVRAAVADASLTSRARRLLTDAERFRTDWNYGNAIHYANLFLGRVALQRRNIHEARVRLLEAGRTPGSPQLDDNGPDMTLAEELLDCGEPAVVLAYFRECQHFWANASKNHLKEWSANVRAGKRPDFGRRSGHWKRT